MLIRTLKSSIIVLIQMVPIALLIAFFSVLFLNHPGLSRQVHDFLAPLKIVFLLIHLLFYTALFCLWPWFISLLISQYKEKPSPHQLATAIRIRLYLVGTLVLIECLTWVG